VRLQSGGYVTITTNRRIILRNFDEADRGDESRIVLTDWSRPLDVQLRVIGNQRGDFDANGEVNQVDIQLFFEQLGNPSPSVEYDLTGDGHVDDLDRDDLIDSILKTSYGDANLDRIFDSRDLLQILQLHQYEDNIAENSDWSSGDWNGDGDFDSSDLILAFQKGRYRI
jgi:hypothetical protein